MWQEEMVEENEEFSVQNSDIYHKNMPKRNKPSKKISLLATNPSVGYNSSCTKSSAKETTQEITRAPN